MRIFDTFPFDRELDLLEHHLEEVFDLVDAFVIVEAAATYRGQPKEHVFDRNGARFDWARDKIRHVKLDSLGSGPTARHRAAVQRNAALLALGEADPEDVVLLLDVDEVPSRSLLERLRAEGLAEPRRLAMTRHYGAADALAPRSPCCPTGVDPFVAAVPWLKPSAWDSLEPCWFGHSAVAAPVAALRAAAPFELRYGLPLGQPISDAGRHFSSVDPEAKVERKLGRLFHEEYDGPRERNPDHLARCRSHGVHHRGWWYAETPAGPLPPDIRRLVEAHPATASRPLPSPLSRRMVRNWAWLRLWRALPEGLVAAIDREFERRRLLLLPALLLADVARSAAARMLRIVGRVGAGPSDPHF